MLDITNQVAGQQSYNGKSLSERFGGRFYTPTQLADELASQVISASETTSASRITATDPFCGDGRLVVALLSIAARNARLARLPWLIELRDKEAAAASAAVERVRHAARCLGMEVEANAVSGDTFAGDISPRFDLVITNPPWELLKPDSRELRHLSVEDAARYKAGLRTISRQLNARFPDACAEGAWGGWGTNLARCGWDLCLHIARKGGVIGIILPATIMGDQSSARMRRKALESNRLLDVAAYPSEARLFERVDQPVVALTMRAGVRPSGAGRIRSFDADRVPIGKHDIELNRTAMEARDWTIPIAPLSGVDELFGKFRELPNVRSFEGDGPTDLWLGRELDETRVSEKLSIGSSHPFIKGRMIKRHGVAESPTMSVHAGLCAGFHSTTRPRAVWRDVARATSKRRMIGTVIPAGWIAGNSLHVACYRDGDPARTAALHAVLSSFVLEVQVRRRLTTGHMSLGVVRQARIPVLNDKLVGNLSSLASIAMNGGGEEAEHRLEVAVAKAYGLNRDELAHLLREFPKLEDREREILTSAAVWSEVGR